MLLSTPHGGHVATARDSQLEFGLRAFELLYGVRTCRWCAEGRLKPRVCWCYFLASLPVARNEATWIDEGMSVNHSGHLRTHSLCRHNAHRQYIHNPTWVALAKEKI